MHIDMKSTFKNIIKIAVILIAAGITGFVLLLGAYMIPGKYAENNIARSVSTLKEEGRYPNLVPWTFSIIDTYTDSVMLLSAMYDGDDKLSDMALMNYKYEKEDTEPEYSIVSYFENGKDDMEVFGYPKYWHGYILFLRPLLSIMTYSTLRIVNTITQVLLVILLLWLLYRKNMKNLIIPCILAIVTLTPISIGWCLQFSAVYYITIIGSIIVVANSGEWENNSRYAFFFLIMGICTSYFDLLTYPLVTYGIPMVVYIASSDRKDVSKMWKKCIRCLIYWGIGYIGMWVLKWGIASVVASDFDMSEVIYSLKNRSAGNTEEGIKCSYIMVLIRNAGVFALNPVIILIIAYVVYNIRRIYKDNAMKTLWLYVKMYAVPLLLPLAWYLGTRNHSYTHCEFTYREWAMSAFALLFALTCTINDIKQNKLSE